MKIVGTDNQEMEVVFDYDCFLPGDLFLVGGKLCSIVRQNYLPKIINPDENIYEYTVYIHLKGEELETAINHFKFLRKYNLA